MMCEHPLTYSRNLWVLLGVSRLVLLKRYYQVSYMMSSHPPLVHAYLVHSWDKNSHITFSPTIYNPSLVFHFLAHGSKPLSQEEAHMLVQELSHMIDGSGYFKYEEYVREMYSDDTQ